MGKILFSIFLITTNISTPYEATKIWGNKIISNKTRKYKNKNLTDLQKHVVFDNGTESPFDNEYWDNKSDGIYVDLLSGKPLFSSIDKFDSGTGWPSFTKPIDSELLQEQTDDSLDMSRVEARSKDSDIHLGHIFNDGPEEHGGMRYCINSASLKFISKEDLKKEGYEKYLNLFETENDGRTAHQKAILSGGCFWGIEELFSKLDGVIDVVSGYTGGNILNPTYEIISSGTSKHAESVEITFDPEKISYEKILKFFFKIHDPTTLNKQGNDIGTQYRSAIFYTDSNQKETAQSLINEANKSGIFPKKLVTKLEKLDKFYKAESYHQDYLTKNPNGYTCHRVREDWTF